MKYNKYNRKSTLILIAIPLLLQSCAAKYIPTGKTADLSIDDPHLYNNSLQIQVSQDKYHDEAFKRLYSSESKDSNELNTKISANKEMYFRISIHSQGVTSYCYDKFSFNPIEGKSYRLIADLSLKTNICRYQLINVTDQVDIKMDRWD